MGCFCVSNVDRDAFQPTAMLSPVGDAPSQPPPMKKSPSGRAMVVIGQSLDKLQSSMPRTSSREPSYSELEVDVSCPEPTSPSKRGRERQSTSASATTPRKAKSLRWSVTLTTPRGCAPHPERHLVPTEELHVTRLELAYAMREARAEAEAEAAAEGGPTFAIGDRVLVTRSNGLQSEAEVTCLADKTYTVTFLGGEAGGSQKQIPQRHAARLMVAAPPRATPDAASMPCVGSEREDSVSA